MELQELKVSSVREIKDYLDSLNTPDRLNYLLDVIDSTKIDIMLPNIKEALQNYRNELVLLSNLNTSINSLTGGIRKVLEPDWKLEALTGGTVYNYLAQ